MNAIDVKAAAVRVQPAGSEHADASSSRPQKLDAPAIAAKFAELKSSPKGLTSDEAKARLAKDGRAHHKTGAMSVACDLLKAG